MNAEAAYKAWKNCRECWDEIYQERAADKTLHNELAAFRKLTVEQQRRHTRGLFDEMSDELK